MLMPAPALSVVLPIYNEEAVLEETLAQLVAALGDLGPSYEVVCVDDGSRDRSVEILETFAAKNPNFRLFFLPRNRGKGAAVRKGMLEADGQTIIFMDADLSTPLGEIARFLGALESGHQVVIGNRHAPGSKITRHQPWIRETLGKGFTMISRLFLAPGVHDFTCGFKAFQKDAAREIFERSTQDGWAFDAELILIAHLKGFKMAQVPVEWRHEKGTKVRLLPAVFGSFKELLAIKLRQLRGGYR